MTPPLTLKGPLHLIEIQICQQCGRLMPPGREVWLIEEDHVPDFYVHEHCLGAFLQQQP
jgi:hypothetical protein